LVDSAQLGGVDLTADLLSCGAIDINVSSMIAVKEAGADSINSHVLNYGPLWLLKVLVGEALGQIEDKLRAELTSALRYIKDAKMTHCADCGMTSGVMGTVIAANLYGRDEENVFGFDRESPVNFHVFAYMYSMWPLAYMLGLPCLRTEEDINGCITVDVEHINCASWGGMFPMAGTYGRGMLNLCISDGCKQMLLDNREFIPHLVSGLFLDPELPRNGDPPTGAPEAIKSVVQRDFAECIQQISLFPPGREALRADPAVMQALTELKEKAWTEEAKGSADRTILALTPKQERRKSMMLVDDVQAGDAKHIMLSCASYASESVRCSHAYLLSFLLRECLTDNWSVQETIIRINKELQRRKYRTWFDVRASLLSSVFTSICT